MVKSVYTVVANAAVYASWRPDDSAVGAKFDFDNLRVYLQVKGAKRIIELSARLN